MSVKPLTFRAQAFGPLAKVEWTVPTGVSAIVGPNRAGKSTLLALPKFIRLAVHENLNEAVKRVFDGPGYLRNFGLPSTSPCGVGMSIDESRWDVEIAITGGAIEAHCAEDHAVKWGDLAAVFSRAFLAYRTCQYEIQHLVNLGSVQTSSTELEPTGANVFPLLRNWRDSSDTEARFEFVMSTLREAFPHISKVDFEQAGQTVTMAIRDRRWADRRVPISRESSGLVTSLLQLCAVASTSRMGLVTIDELETSLHPHAIRVLISAFRRWAREHDLRIVFATQSETVLDQFHDDPGQIYVLEPGQETSPRCLTDLFDGDYLNQFSLGDLFSHLEFGSNREPPTSP